jgi:AcrR family transcriptional regulator
MDMLLVYAIGKANLTKFLGAKQVPAQGNQKTTKLFHKTSFRVYVFPIFAGIMEKMEIEILDTAKVLFHRYGLRPVTMDDIAKDLSISKKTLYKYFSNKEELVDQAINSTFESISSRMFELLSGDGNAIEMLFKMDEVICSNIETHDPGLHFQLQRYYPELFSKLEGNKREIVFKMMHANISQGKEEGLYRADLDEEVVTFLYYSRAVLMQEEDMGPFKDRPMEMVMREILIYHVRGIASPKGLKYLENRLNTNINTSR